MNSHKILLSAIFLLGLSLVIPSAMAAGFSATVVGSSTINASSSSQSLTIMVTNLDASANITKVNVTITSFVYVTGTNSTTAINNSFGNTSTSNIVWSNTTDNGFITIQGGIQNFTFGVNAPAIAGNYNFTVNVTDTSELENTTIITYSVVDNPAYSLTFANYSAKQQASNTIQNLSYVIGITNNDAVPQMYNLSAVNCSNVYQAGIGNLNVTSAVTINANTTVYVQLNVSNDTVGMYSSCIMANHWNGTMDTSYNFTSLQNGVILNSSFLPDLTVPFAYWTSAGLTNPFAGGNITIYAANLDNVGDFNLTENITVKLLWDNALMDNVTVAASSLGNTTAYNITTFANITGITNGLHNLSIWVDALGNLSEYNESNNYYNTTVFVGYNITVVSVAGQSGYNATTNRNITINVSVRYANGSAVTGLGKENFTVYDQQAGTMITSSNPTLNASFTSTMNSSGVYWFSITTPIPVNDTDTTPGVHNITVGASRNESGNLYSGNNTGSPYYYLIVPRPAITFTASLASVNEGSTRSITINVTNTGNDPIYNVSILTPTLGSYLSAGSLGGCLGKCFVAGSGNVINPGEFMSQSVTVTGLDVTGDELSTVSATVRGTYNNTGTFIGYEETEIFAITVVMVTSTGSTTDDDSGSGGSTTRACTTDSSCTANESCVSRVCKAISCSGGTILDHVCVQASYKINVTSFEPALQMVSGGNVSTKVTVKNTGVVTMIAKLEVVLSGVTATVTPASYSLDAGESYQFTVAFIVPESTKLGNLSGKFKAYVSTSTSSYDQKDFSFTVLPKEETKAAINLSYQEIAAALTQLMVQFSQMKASGKYNQSVIIELEDMIAAANNTLNVIKGSMDSDDYVRAESLITQVNASLEGIRAEITGSQAVGAAGQMQIDQGVWFWVAIVVIIIFVVGFFVYMFYPSSSSHQGYHPERGYGPVTGGGPREGIGARIKNLFKRKKQPVQASSVSTFAKSILEPSEEHYEAFHYSEGYKKERSSGQENSNVIKGLFGKLKKKKQKKSPQMHIDQFAEQAVSVQ
jgi:hypothetical protein